MLQGALKGIKVLDLSRILAAPLTAQIFGDLGANVIKVERPGTGDDTRAWGPPFAGGEAAYYLCANRNKRSITLDFKKNRDILDRLIKWADIILLNFPFEVLKKNNLCYEDIRPTNPKIIYGLITGYGTSGPYAGKTGFDVAVQGMGGIMSITGEPDGGPMKVGVAIVDVTAALYLAIGLLSALHHREKTGEGQFVDVSLLDSQVSWLINVASGYLVSGKPPKRYGNEHPHIVPYQVFQVKDGHIVLAVGNDKQFRDLCDVLEKPEWKDDPDYATNPARVKNREILIPMLQKIFLQDDRDNWVEKMENKGVPGGPINTIDKVFEDPQVIHREMLIEMEHPTAKKLKLVGSPIKMSNTPVSYRQAPPLLGEHTREILIELGYKKEEIEIFIKEGIV